MKKICSKCNIEQEIESFYKYPNGKRFAQCKTCVRQKQAVHRKTEDYKEYQKAYQSLYRESNPEKIKELSEKHKKLKAKIRSQEKAKRIYSLLNQSNWIDKTKKAQTEIKHILMSSHCCDCGNDNWIVLEFDHVRGEKEFNISEVRRMYWCAEIKNEIDKCDIVCANCHRIRTHHRTKSWRTI